jgi:hypothetical protein
MATKNEIDQRYLDLANQLEAEYFDIIDEGLPTQHRVLKAGKSVDNFNAAHAQIWQSHEAELIANGFMKPLPAPEPVRDLAAELDQFKADIQAIKTKLGMK